MPFASSVALFVGGSRSLSAKGLSVRVPSAEGRGRSASAELVPFPDGPFGGRLHHAQRARALLQAAQDPGRVAMHSHQRDVSGHAR